MNCKNLYNEKYCSHKRKMYEETGITGKPFCPFATGFKPGAKASEQCGAYVSNVQETCANCKFSSPLAFKEHTWCEWTAPPAMRLPDDEVDRIVRNDHVCSMWEQE